MKNLLFIATVSWCALTLVSFWMFVWHAELFMAFLQDSNWFLTNGYTVSDPVKVYHKLMYIAGMMIFVQSVLCVWLAKEKVVGR